MVIFLSLLATGLTVLAALLYLALQEAETRNTAKDNRIHELEEQLGIVDQQLSVPALGSKSARTDKLAAAISAIAGKPASV